MESRASHPPSNWDQNSCSFRLFEDKVIADFVPEEPLSSAIESHLTDLREQCVALSSSIAGNHLWQRDGFSLRVSRGSERSIPHLFGELEFAENIDDEWFAVHILIALTRAFPSLTGTITDNDGQFLLIEAAELLPSWLTVEKSENRIFIRQGSLHIVPLPSSPSELVQIPVSPTLHQALEVVLNDSIATKVSTDLQQKAFSRAIAAPQLSIENQHHVMVKVPVGVAMCLKHAPALVAPAVRTFCDRDPVSLRVCSRMAVFPPSPAVTIRLRTTRCLHAMLCSQKFHPPKAFSNFVPSSTSNNVYRESMLGMMLACGFEMMCVGVDSSETESEVDEIFWDSNRHWQAFKASLTRHDYFAGALAGSQPYRDREARAQMAFTRFHQVASQTRTLPGDDGAWLGCDDQDRMGSVTAGLVNHGTITPRDVVTALLKLEPDPRPESFPLPDVAASDDESWMHMKLDDVDAMLNDRQMNLQLSDLLDDDDDSSENDDDDDDDVTAEEAEAAKTLTNVADQMKSFVEQVSGLDGIEMGGTADHDDEDDPDYEESDEGSMDFNEMKMMTILRDTLKGVASLSPPELLPEPPAETAPSHSTEPSDQDYHDAMDHELRSTHMGQSFTHNTTDEHPDTVHADDADEPVNVDLNLVQNILASLDSQSGAAGPLTGLMGELGLSLAPDPTLYQSKKDE